MRTFAGRPRRAFTLIELVVVLAVLIVLAGLVVPRLRNDFFKAHGSGCVANISELAKWWETYRIDQGNYSRYPDRLDNLCQSDDTLYSLLLPPLSAQLTTYPLTAPDVTVLGNAGLTRVMVPSAAQPAPPDRNATMFLGSETPLAVGSTVAIFDPATPEGARTLDLLGQDAAAIAGGRYYVFGVGSQCTAVGNAILDAPTHITESPPAPAPRRSGSAAT